MAVGYQLHQLAQLDAAQSMELFAEVVDNPEALSSADPAVAGGLLRVLHTLALRHDRNTVLLRIDPSVFVRINEAIPKKTSNRYLIGHMLAISRTPDALGTLIEFLKFHPPSDWMHAAQVISPLMQSNDWPVEAVFPELLSCIAERSLASPIIDLANFLTRSNRVSVHPAAEQVQALNHLLGEVSHRLGKFEENPREFGDDVETVQDRLGQAVALAVSLCDAVGLIGDETSIGKLNQAVELRHRRVQCEAAGALAKFDDEHGKERLVELSKDPAARLRAIHYLDELELGDLVDDQERTPNAIAESELAIWLCQPQQMGVPPTDVEAIESRRLMWPSFNDPVDVFLVRYEYNFGQQQFSNIGITGPVVHTMAADVAELPTDDIFAIYAGWHAEHEEIFSIPVGELNPAQARMLQPLIEHLERAGYEGIQPLLLCFMLDEHAAVFEASREDTKCLVVSDALETIDHPIAGRPRPLMPEDLFNLYKGRKMLRTFNS